MRDPNPVVIGGVAGSGTRVYHTICASGGIDMGGWATSPSSGDNRPLIRAFYPRWVNRYASGALDEAGLRRMRRELAFWLRLSYPIRRRRWGWKNPRTMYILPLLHEMFPSMAYIHVVRDGRDQAFNPHFDYRPHETSLLSEAEARLDDPVRKALHWSRLNQTAESYALAHLPDRYLRSRLEDLCADPRQEVARILHFLNAESARAVEEGAAAVRTPSSLGRWRREPAEVVARVEQTIGPALRHYGYDLVGVRA